MSNLKMYCITVQDSHLDLIQNLNYIPVGLGNNINSELFTRDNIGKNISQKNPFYGEYTFHYWLWKNKPEIFEDNKWIGFCQYRKFWTQKHITQDLKDINAKLWVIEDDKRDCEKNKDFGEKFIKLSRDVHFLNDDRAKIKLKINNHTGSAIKEIKEYTSY